MTGRSAPDLRWLIHPYDVDAFFAEHWERRHLLVRRDAPRYYDELMTLARFDGLLTTTGMTSTNVRVVEGGRSIPISDLIGRGWRQRENALEAVLERYRGGASIVLNFVHERDRPLQRLCRALAVDLSASVQVNVYLTPAGSRGLAEHWDTHDVFVVQVEGAKRWKVRAGPIALPYEHQAPRGPIVGSDPIDEFVVRPGDVLYVPRGLVHDVAAEEGPSLHLTIGVHPLTWGHVLRGAVEELFESDARFREALPPGFVGEPGARERGVGRARELVAALVGALDPASMIDDAVEAVAQARAPVLDGHLLDLRDLESITLDTRLRRRASAAWRVVPLDERLALRIHGKQIDMPAWLDEELQFMRDAEVFSAAEIPSDLDDEGRLTLVHKLVSEGALTIDRPGGAE